MRDPIRWFKCKLKPIIFIVDTCQPLMNRIYTKISYSESPLANGRYPVGTEANYTCPEGYTFILPVVEVHSLTCQTKGEWVGNRPPFCYG